ncbi:MAG: M12 family metallo-peptidase, partial [Acidobacteria bacterium]|nr:M12 family metallo-peptidase [Acidobacteriota bacterium]
NGLTGPIPDSLGDLANLEELWLLENSLTGPIPDSLGDLANLEILVLSWNGLTGPIPDSLGDLANLEILSLAANSLTGPVSDSLGDLANLEELWLLENSLTGPIPDSLGDLANLEILVLSWNGLTGPIPDSLGDLANLKELWLLESSLTGPIPDSLGDLANLEILVLSWNGLTGPIPDSLGDLANLKELWLLENSLTGPIPDSLGDLVNLEILYLERNGLTGPIPAQLANLVNLEELHLFGNRLTGPIPAPLGNLVRLRTFAVGMNDLTGPIPAELGKLTNLEWLSLGHNWHLSGSLSPDLENLRAVNILVTQACAPAAWRDRLGDNLIGRSCGGETDVTVDVAVFYTPSARRAMGGSAATEAVIDLMIAETNQAYEASGVSHRVALRHRSEVAYTEAGYWNELDLERLENPDDGHMDEVHAQRDRVGADLVHLIVDADRSDWGGLANLGGPFGLTIHIGGGRTFAHELGHNMGLEHDRWEKHHNEGGVYPHPAHGYVNQRAFESGASPDTGWVTIMSYPSQCEDAGIYCQEPLRFSNPRQRYRGDPLGVAYGGRAAGAVTGPADAAAVLNNTLPAVALWRDHRPNRRPTAAGTLVDRRLTPDATLTVDVSQAFADPDGDALGYAVSSSAPEVVSARMSGAARVTLTAAQVGEATIRMTATDPSGLSATQSFSVTVTTSAPFTDDPIVPGLTPVRAVHFTELRTRIDALRRAARLGPFSWTDSVLTAGVTPVRLVHLLELREALVAAYVAAGRRTPRFTDAGPMASTTPIRATHLMELRAAVIALE